MKRFNADGITWDNFEGIKAYRKKPLVVHAVQINFPEGFKVTSKEGIVKGYPGDFLMFGGAGDKYICKKESFEQEYQGIELPPPPLDDYTKEDKANRSKHKS